MSKQDNFRREFIESMPEAEYHADPCNVPSLSSSMANMLLSSSPAHAHHAHPMLGGAPMKRSKTMAMGTIVHELLLGTGGGIVALDFDNWRTKAAQASKEVAEADGKTPILTRELDAAEVAVAAIKATLADRGVAFSGVSEATILWVEASRSGGVQCKARLDHLIRTKDGGAIVYDIKTSRSAQPRKIARSVEDYGYHTQCAAYTRAMEAHFKGCRGRVENRWIFCELEAPYAVTIAQPSGGLFAIGNMRWERAVQAWGKCLAEDKWPQYHEGTALIEPMPWALDREFELQGETT